MTVDQFTRWTCAKCGQAGFDSWNKALHDGINFAGAYPNPFILGDNCQRCGHPATVAYTTMDAAPRAIYGPVADSYAYEPEAMATLEASPEAGVELQPSGQRDSDWRGGCISALVGPPPDPFAIWNCRNCGTFAPHPCVDRACCNASERDALIEIARLRATMTIDDAMIQRAACGFRGDRAHHSEEFPPGIPS